MVPPNQSQDRRLRGEWQAIAKSQSYQDFLSDYNKNPLRETELLELRMIIASLKNRTQATVMSLILSGMEQKEVGDILNLTQGRVSQICKDSLQVLRRIYKT